MYHRNVSDDLLCLFQSKSLRSPGVIPFKQVMENRLSRAALLQHISGCNHSMLPFNPLQFFSCFLCRQPIFGNLPLINHGFHSFESHTSTPSQSVHT